jgi:uncharacterized protein YndB with AHSA1/START domain
MKKPTKPTPATIDNTAFGAFTAPGEVRIIRLLPGPIERVWAFLTDPAKRARWFCGGATEQKAGGKVVFAMRHKDIAPGEKPPKRYAHVQDPGVTFQGTVLRCEPPRLLSHTFGSKKSEVTFELTPQGKQVVLVLTHRTRGSERADLCNYASGWHTHLAILVAELEGAKRPPFWSMHAKLEAKYEKLAAKLAKAAV